LTQVVRPIKKLVPLAGLRVMKEADWRSSKELWPFYVGTIAGMNTAGAVVYCIVRASITEPNGLSFKVNDKPLVDWLQDLGAKQTYSPVKGTTYWTPPVCNILSQMSATWGDNPEIGLALLCGYFQQEVPADQRQYGDAQKLTNTFLRMCDVETVPSAASAAAASPRGSDDVISITVA
jgi:hypothetical protein